MSRFASYLIAQYVPDLMKREPRNVGVFVQIGNEVQGKFLGEIEPGRLDKRKINTFPYPTVYEQWVDYWRGTMSDPEAFQTFVRAGKDFFPVIEGGEVWDIGQDSIDDVTEILFKSLVGDGNFAKALGGFVQEEDVTAPLRESISRELITRSILVEGNEVAPLYVPHPIRTERQIPGTKVAVHRPTFVQEFADNFAVIEAVDFTTTKYQATKDHAGWASFMFSDIKHRSSEADTISIIRVAESDEHEKITKYAISMLKSCSRVVDWNDETAQAEFLAQCNDRAIQNGHAV
ncbi:MAG: hypothetical protein ABSF29_01550 [Tepidisphaeraceae bacterium]